MKINIFLACATLSLVGLTSCNGGNALTSQELEGTWKGQPTMIPNTLKSEPHEETVGASESYEMSCTPLLTFVRAEDTRGGKIDISADFTITKEVGMIEKKFPVSASVNGNAKTSGTWIIEDNDDVKLILNTQGIEVELDNSTLTLSCTHPTDSIDNLLKAMKEQVAANIDETFKPMVMGKIQNITEFEDVNVADNIMTLEIGNKMITFTKQ